MSENNLMPEAPVEKKDNKKVIIIVVAVLLLCCCCAVVVAAWQFMPAITDLWNNFL
jgi:flagellar basal body-associated protein FliL